MCLETAHLAGCARYAIGQPLRHRDFKELPASRAQVDHRGGSGLGGLRMGRPHHAAAVFGDGDAAHHLGWRDRQAKVRQNIKEANIPAIATGADLSGLRFSATMFCVPQGMEGE